MASSTRESTVGSGRTGLFSPVTDPQTYRNLAFLLLRFPIGIAYFTVFVTGLAVGVSLIPLLIGIPILAVVLGFADYAGVFEAKLCRQLLGVDLHHSPAHDPSEKPMVAYLKATLTAPRLYLLVGYFLASQFVGIATFTTVLVLFTLGVSLTVAPLTYSLPFAKYELPELGGAGGEFVVTTLPEALLLSVVGLTILFVSVHVVNALATAHGSVTAAVLGHRN